MSLNCNTGACIFVEKILIIFIYAPPNSTKIKCDWHCVVGKDIWKKSCNKFKRFVVKSLSSEQFSKVTPKSSNSSWQTGLLNTAYTVSEKGLNLFCLWCLSHSNVLLAWVSTVLSLWSIFRFLIIMNNNCIQRRSSRFYTLSSLRRELSPTQSCANHVQHVERLSCARCCVPHSTKGQLSY